MHLGGLQRFLRKRPLAGFAFAAALAALALQIRFWIGPALANVPFITFFPAVLLAAYLAGTRAGAFCATVSGLLAWYWLMKPERSFALVWPSGVVALVFFGLVAGLMVYLLDVIDRAYARLLASERERARLNEELEQRVEHRTRELAATNERLQGEIRAREEAQTQAAQLQRMDAIGQLTGGVAHDFNNILGIVIGNLDLAQRRIAQGRADIVRYVDNALDGARRGATLTQRLLAFARKQPLQPAVVDANAVVSGMSELLRRTLGEQVEIECVLAGGLWRTQVDPGQLESAIVNLAVNARDAMPQGGKLTIETANAHLDDAYALANPDSRPGQYVLVAVSDTGAGMPAGVAARAFEPFFTTKDVGKGTGLGLSQIYGYLKQSGGHAKIYSESGRGTTVRLYFPRHFGRVATDNAAAPASAAATEPQARAGERILIVEDEAGVRATAVEMLRDLGYDMAEAPDGPTALDALANGATFDLLFTDVVLPGMSGRELAEQARQQRPDLRVLYTTGYTRNAIVHDGQLDPDVQLLSKPYTADQLARKIRDVLDR